MRNSKRIVLLAALTVGAQLVRAEARAQQAQQVQAARVDAACDLPHAAGVSTQQMTSGGRPRSYRLFVPQGYDSRRRMPLVLDLHGSGGNAAGQARTSGFETVAASEGFLVATLEAESGRWNVPVQPGRPDDVAYASDVIDHVAAQACTDLSRVFATGFSGGGRMSSLLGCRLTQRLAAIAPVSALRFPAPCDGRALPVLSFHGLADPQNPYDGHAPGRGAEWEESVPAALAGWAARNHCKSTVTLEDPAGPLSIMRYEGCEGGADVRLVRIDGLGHRWTREEIDTTVEMWRFFARQRRP
jgi:polyhydroxybutyrate depolymerase